MPPRQRKTTKANPATGATRLRVRMYRQGLGDCLLLTFDDTAHILIDCGSIGATQPASSPMTPVVENIIATTGGKLAALVATHEHEDHVSGFRTHITQLRKGLVVEETWQAWTEDASDAQAKHLQKYKDDLVRATGIAARTLSRLTGGDAALAALGAATVDLLAFNGGDLGAAGLKPRSNEAMSNALSLGKKPLFLSPGMVFERPWAPGARFYVLGPPRDEQLLHDMGRRGSPDLYQDFAAALPTPDPDARDSGSPFEELFRRSPDDPAERSECALSYDAPGLEWRRIDADWLGVAADFGLQLDSYTNNTSLVLAIEIGEQVLLFPGDAQLGSWKSWQQLSWTVQGKKVTASDLLKRVVFYKVGHHSSHNATATASGLELMEHDDLVAFIPLDGAVAKKKGWEMPAPHLYERLLEKTRGRVVRSDLGWPDTKARPPSISQSIWDQAAKTNRIQREELYVDYLL